MAVNESKARLDSPQWAKWRASGAVGRTYSFALEAGYMDGFRYYYMNALKYMHPKRPRPLKNTK
jgi:hypothetical protein